MGSRAIVVVCADADVAAERFGVTDGSAGVVPTRTGRPFFDDAAVMAGVVERVRAAVTGANLWDALSTGWLVLDCEFMPWSAKALDLLRRPYAAVDAAATAGLSATSKVLEQAAGRGQDVEELLGRTRTRAEHVAGYRDAYRRYVWPVAGIDDLRLAPFHVLAAESGVFVDRDHRWHLAHCDALVDAARGWMQRTGRRFVDLADRAAQDEAVAWWQQLTAAGGEGMVVKPLGFAERGAKGLVQPGIKCRGREYLRIIYGPEYADPTQIDRLRNLGRKRSLAVREFALGVEALERFVGREPLYRVHECVFAVLALESDPVDPRLSGTERGEPVPRVSVALDGELPDGHRRRQAKRAALAALRGASRGGARPAAPRPRRLAVKCAQTDAAGVLATAPAGASARSARWRRAPGRPRPRESAARTHGPSDQPHPPALRCAGLGSNG